jgi:hypothetical protein
MPPGVLGVVLALAVHVISGLLKDLRCVGSRVLGTDRFGSTAAQLSPRTFDLIQVPVE